VTDQPQNGPTERTGAGSEPTGEMPAALGHDSPTDVQPVDETQLPGGPAAPAVPPPPPASATAMDSQGAEAPAAVPPPEPGESASTLPPPVGRVGSDSPAWRPEDEPSGAAAVAADRPEVAVGAAFAGGLVLALILKRLAR
jgi:hypothetical protein